MQAPNDAFTKQKDLFFQFFIPFRFLSFSVVFAFVRALRDFDLSSSSYAGNGVNYRELRRGSDDCRSRETLSF